TSVSSVLRLYGVCVFFFQAEDGIRDRNVTGVQTCALPIYPAVREKMIRKRDALKETDVPCVVLDIPLLYENDLTHFVDKTIVVAVHEDVQLDRLMKRDHYDKTEAKQRIAAQMPIKEKAALADAVLDNNGTRAATREQLKDVLKKWGVFP